MMSPPVILGEKFGRWTVISESSSSRRHQRCVAVRCDCGNESTVRFDSLTSGCSQSCGCLQKEVEQRFYLDIGAKFQRWTVIAEAAPTSRGRTCYVCECACGKQRTVQASSLVSGKSKSCGCFKRDAASVRATARVTHGLTGTPEYRCWSSLKGRCLNSHNRAFSSYGGRGVCIHPPWITSFETFLVDVGSRPSPQHSIDRIDVNGNYEPGNVRWATALEQHLNRRNSPMLTFKSETHTVGYWAWKYKIDVNRVKANLALGLTPYEAVFLGYPRTRKRREMLNWRGCNEKMGKAA